MSPAALNDADIGLRHEVGQGPAQEIGRRDEVGIKNRDDFALAFCRASCQGAGFETVALIPADVLDFIAAAFQLCELARNQLNGRVGGIIKHLDEKFVSWVIKGCHRIKESAGDIGLVV